jgi:hypothetical protein
LRDVAVFACVLGGGGVSRLEERLLLPLLFPFRLVLLSEAFSECDDCEADDEDDDDELEDRLDAEDDSESEEDSEDDDDVSSLPRPCRRLAGLDFAERRRGMLLVCAEAAVVVVGGSKNSSRCCCSDTLLSRCVPCLVITPGTDGKLDTSVRSLCL